METQLLKRYGENIGGEKPFPQLKAFKISTGVPRREEGLASLARLCHTCV